MEAFERIKKFIEGSEDEELSFVALKPNAINTVAAKLVMDKLTENGYKVIFHAPAIYTPDNVKVHYKEIYDGYVADPEGKFKFYKELEQYMSGIIYGFIVAGSVKDIKKLFGATKNPDKGTVRFDYTELMGIDYDKDKNGFHASGEVDEARREIGNFVTAAYTNINYSFEEAQQLADVADVVEQYIKNTEEEKETTL